MISLELTEWQHVRPEDDKRLRGLRLSEPHSRTIAECLTERKMLEISNGEDGVAVRSFSHVGRIELEGLTITVRPKLASNALLELLRYAYSLHDLRLFDQADFSTGTQGLQDLLIAQLHAEAREIVHRGVARRYVRRTDELASPRGRLEVARLALRRNPSISSLACTHYPRSSDFLLNQVVRAGLQLAGSSAVAANLRRGIARTAALYAELARPVELSSAILKNASRSINRLCAAYGPVVRLIDLLHQSSHLDLEHGASVRLTGFLFDMNRFFQALVGRFLHESLPNCRVENEVSLRHIMGYAPGFNPQHRRAPKPRPDFIVTRGHHERRLLDAKYRDLWRNDLPREMLYQLAIYAMSQPRGATAAILYPTEDSAARDAIIDIRDPSSDAVRAHVALRPVIVPVLLELLSVPHERSREREVLATALAFGAKS